MDVWSSLLWQRWGDLLGFDSSFRVGIYLPRSVDSLLLMLVCMRLGVTMVPLDVHYPPQKTIQMIQAARLHSLITSGQPSAQDGKADPQQPQPAAPAAATSSSASYPSIHQLVALAQQAATDPISDLIADVQLLELEELARSSSELARSSGSLSSSSTPSEQRVFPTRMREAHRGAAAARLPSTLPHAADTTNVALGTGQRCGCTDVAGRAAPAMYSSAYLLFTSGSTGISKAVPMSHLQLAVHLDALQQRLPLTSADVFVPMASFCFVAHTRLWSALASGATLCVPSDQQRTAILPFASLLRAMHHEHGLSLSVLDTSPAFLRMLMQDQHGLLSAAQSLLLSWRRVTLAGEIVTWKMTRAVYDQHTRYAALHGRPSLLEIVNLYGATECASTICAFQVPRTADSALSSSFVPVGAPLATTCIVLLDEHGSPIPQTSDTVGHVHVGGSRVEVSVGYDRDANTTMTRFARHPKLQGLRLFHSGDMGRWTGPDGNGALELVGRSDNMVKIRGQRVELEELESTLAHCDLVDSVQVVAHRRDVHDEEETLLAFVVPSQKALKDGSNVTTPLSFSGSSLLSPAFASKRPSIAAPNSTSAFSFSPLTGPLIAPASGSAVGTPGTAGSAPVGQEAVPSALVLGERASAASSVSPRVSLPNLPFIPLNPSSSALLKLASTLRSDVGRHHPFYYVPKHFLFVSALARLPNGKIDRQAGKAAAAEWLSKKQHDEEEEKAMAVQEGDESAQPDEDVLTAALTIASTMLDPHLPPTTSPAPHDGGHHRAKSTVDKYAEQLQPLTAMERALWSAWMRLFVSLTARKQMDVLQAVNATKRGADDEVNGADDFDFFALGGDSLLANTLVSLVAAAPTIRREMTVRDAFDHPSLIAMAAFLETAKAAPEPVHFEEARRSSGTRSFPVPPSVSGVDGNGRPYVEYPLSPSESGLWFAIAVAGRPLAAHHISHIYAVERFEGNTDDINMRALETALHYLVVRHEALRTVFVTNSQGEPRQRVLAAGGSLTATANGLPPLYTNVALHSVDSEQGVHRVVEGIDHTPFELHQWPLFRVSVIKVKPPAQADGLPEPEMRSRQTSEQKAATHQRRRSERVSLRSTAAALSSDTFLSLTIHHLVSDGWSSGMLLRELSACYLHFSNPNSSRRYSLAAPDHPSLPSRAAMQFVEFQQAQAVRLQAEEKAHVAYWVDELKDASYLELPYDFSRPLQRSYDGDCIHLDFPSSLSSALHALSLSSRCSLFNLLMAAFQLLMSKYSAQRDIVIGTASANRDSAETQEVMGYCINMVACRGVVDQSQTFLQHAKAVQHKTLEALEHGRVPFSAVVSAVHRAQSGGKGGAKDSSRNPLFDVILLLQNQPIRASSYALKHDGSVHLARVPFRASHAQFDLAFILEPGAERTLQLSVNYNVQVFRRDSVSRMVDNWLHLMQRLAAAPASPMAEHEWISPSQRRVVVERFNQAKAAPVPIDHPAQYAFELQVAERPHALAVESWEERWTYAELEAKANQVANAVLTAYSQRYDGAALKPDTLIGLYVDRKAGCAMPAAVLGILKAGAAYVPLDPTYPEARLGYMVQDSDVKLVLTVSRMQDALTALIAGHNAASDAAERIPAVPVLCIDAILSPSSPHSAARPPVINGVADLAYVIYTSGSTGKPKGVMIQHLSVVNLAQFMRPYMTSHPQRDGSTRAVEAPRCLQFSSISFDVAVFEWATTFASGGCLCLVPSVDQLLGEALLHTVAKYGITTLLASASSVAAVPLNSGQGGACVVDLSGLSFMSCGSEALQEAVLHRWMSACPAAFFNQYGPTEVTVTSHMCHYQPVTEYPYHNNRVIGGGIANVQSYVCDQHMRPVPVGVSGELYIGGAGVARGYLNRPELTAQRFIPNPFLSHALSEEELVAGVSTRTWESTRVYRTGDVVRWTVAGELEYMGRNDSQVKVRGFRVEIGEIEKRILEHPLVHTTVVVLRQERLGGGSAEATPTLTCFFTWKQPVTPDGLAGVIAALRAHVGATLPPYMVPTYFVQLDAIPQTCTGKFDRNALTDMDIQPFLTALRQHRGKGHRAKPSLLVVSPPSSPSRHKAAERASEAGLLRALKTAWATALSIDADTLELSDHFFEIGGHSLLTLRVLALLPARLQPHLTLADVFANPTLQGQLELLTRKTIARSDDAFSTTPRASLTTGEDVPPIRATTAAITVGDVAIVGMAGRFPGASSVAAFWSNLLAGEESIRRFTADELLAAGVDPATLQSPDYVPACGLMGEQAEADVSRAHARSMFGFDAGFFDLAPKDAEMTDPQQRHFLEVCHQALEDAACVPQRYQRGVDEAADGRASEPTIGVFAGCGRNTYLADYLSSSYDVSGSAAHWHALCSANDKDFLCSRVSYKLGLLGPACVVQTACSSSLVAVHSAMASIQRGECEVAVAGGVSFGALHPQGYTYQPDHILSSDGHCRALDAGASGTMRGQGLAVVVLKPLALARRDRDRVYCVIKASAINNDGSSKASFSAPNPEGQRRVIAQALRAVAPRIGASRHPLRRGARHGHEDRGRHRAHRTHSGVPGGSSLRAA